MKPFDLEAAKRGEPIQLRDGTPCKFIAHVPEAIACERVIALLSGVETPNLLIRTEAGKYDHGRDNGRDLMMVGENESWFVFRKGTSVGYGGDEAPHLPRKWRVRYGIFLYDELCSKLLFNTRAEAERARIAGIFARSDFPTKIKPVLVE